MYNHHSPVAALLMLLSLVTLKVPARADGFCFSLAENYYEQVYCELKALGRAHDLPSWRDFRNNDETTQALLLKRPAQRAGITVGLPAPPETPSQIRADRQPTVSAEPTIAQGMHHCVLETRYITCAGEQFEFVPNRHNSLLRAGALSTENRMNLPEFDADHSDPRAVANYLHAAFIYYLNKMMDIGLAETTLTFTKFHYFFTDLAARGVSFQQRFETMFTYLKKDKANLSVPVSKQAPSVSLAACRQLSHSLIGCDAGRRHILFQRRPQQSATTATGTPE